VVFVYLTVCNSCICKFKGVQQLYSCLFCVMAVIMTNFKVIMSNFKAIMSNFKVILSNFNYSHYV